MVNGDSKQNRNETNDKYGMQMKEHNMKDNNITETPLYLSISHAQTYLDSNDYLITSLYQLKVREIQYCVSLFPGVECKIQHKI
jgi:hypothetical protein